MHEDRLDGAAAGGADGWGEWDYGVNLASDTDEFSENVTVGDPCAASAERGEALLDDATGSLASVLDAVRERERS